MLKLLPLKLVHWASRKSMLSGGQSWRLQDSYLKGQPHC